MIDSDYRGVWREGDYLIARHRVAQFPPKCIICGSEGNSQALTCKIRKRPGILPILFFVLGPFSLLFGIFSPSITIKPYLCTEHRKRELRSRWIGHILILTALAMIVFPAILASKDTDSVTSYALIAVGATMTWAWIYYRIFRSRIIWARQIKKWDAWLPDVDPTVLALIPELPA